MMQLSGKVAGPLAFLVGFGSAAIALYMSEDDIEYTTNRQTDKAVCELSTLNTMCYLYTMPWVYGLITGLGGLVILFEMIDPSSKYESAFMFFVYFALLIGFLHCLLGIYTLFHMFHLDDHDPAWCLEFTAGWSYIIFVACEVYLLRKTTGFLIHASLLQKYLKKVQGLSRIRLIPGKENYKLQDWAYRATFVVILFVIATLVWTMRTMWVDSLDDVKVSSCGTAATTRGENNDYYIGFKPDSDYKNENESKDNAAFTFVFTGGLLGWMFQCLLLSIVESPGSGGVSAPAGRKISYSMMTFTKP